MKKITALVLVLCCGHALVNAQNTYTEISLPALMKKYQQNASNMVIVDVRTQGEYHDTVGRYKSSDIGRIKGAINITVQDLDQKPETIKQLEQYKDKEIYLICSHSFRSRFASNILLKNGFTHVNNVQGGMTEWYRRYDELAPYRAALETSIPYKNTSSGELFDQLVNKKDILLIGINVVPKMPWDSTTAKYLHYYPTFKKAVYFNNTDSLKILELVKQQPGKPVILFNNFSIGGAEIADWLAGQGIPNVQYLVGGMNYFIEYAANKNQLKKAAQLLTADNSIQYITPLYFCNELAGKQGATLIDLRHDTLYNKVNDGIKNNYTHVKGSVNFNAEKGVEAFEQQFPDRKALYTMVSRNGGDGLKLAEELSKKGYTINWILGGMQRFDWYSINMETFRCTGYLLK
jgi:rhodanese-related sulfurtransferase